MLPEGWGHATEVELQIVDDVELFHEGVDAAQGEVLQQVAGLGRQLGMERRPAEDMPAVTSVLRTFCERSLDNAPMSCVTLSSSCEVRALCTKRFAGGAAGRAARLLRPSRV